MTTSLKATCDGVFCEDRKLLITDLVDTEHRLARELASVRRLFHITLEQLHEKGRRHDRLREQDRELRDENRRLHDELAKRRAARGHHAA